MMPFASFLSGIWAKIAAAGAIVLAVLVVVVKLLGAGRAQQRAADAEKTIRDVEKRHEIDQAVAREPAPADKLRDGWSRD